MNEPAQPIYTRGSHTGRVANRRLLAIFIGLFGVLVIGAAAAIAGGERSDLPASCEPGVPCAPPIGRPPLEPPSLVSWKSSEFGFRLEYNKNLWTKLSEDGRSLTLKLDPSEADLTLVIGGARARQASPQALLDKELDEIRDDIQNLTADTEPAHMILGAGVGYRDGVGGAYTGEVKPVLGPGPGKQLWIAVMAATDGGVTTFVSLATSEADERYRVKKLYREVDSILNAFRWPSRGS